MTANDLMSILRYDQETGLFTWLVSPNNRISIGQVAGNTRKDGYVKISIKRKLYSAHRLAFLFTTGSWPEREIDHKNGNRSDNRIRNLRLATRSNNNANATKPSHNTSGFKGVSFHKHTGKFRAYINRKHLGCFETLEQAVIARNNAALLLHGEFANSGGKGAK